MKISLKFQLVILFGWVSPIFVKTVQAADSALAPASQEKWPQEVIVTVGDIRTRIDGPKLWTMSGIEFQNAVMATEDSAYGSVVTIRGVGHLGTAHFLDVPGKPGEIEKEVVTSLKLFIDDQPVSSFAPEMKLNGKSFRMERTSKIRDLSLESSVSIRNGLLIETARMRANKAVDLQMTYPLMYAWTSEATAYLFGDDNGIQKRGVFRKEGSIDHGPEKNSRWMAVFNPSTGKGSVGYLIKHPANADGWLQWTDAPGIYRKLRIMSFVEKIVPEGFDGTFQAGLGFFSATDLDWEKSALAKVDEVKALTENIK